MVRGVDESGFETVTLSWVPVNSDSNELMTLYYSLFEDGSELTIIGEDIDLASGVYEFNTASLDNGTYYLFVTVGDSDVLIPTGLQNSFFVDG